MAHRRWPDTFYRDPLTYRKVDEFDVAPFLRCGGVWGGRNRQSSEREREMDGGAEKKDVPRVRSLKVWKRELVSEDGYRARNGASRAC